MSRLAHDALVLWLEQHPGVELQRGADGLSVFEAGRRVHPPIDPRIVRPGRSLLHRAVQGKRGGRSRIVDATAGFGRDALALIQAGHDVVAVERHPLMHAILRDLAERLDRARTGHPNAAAWGRLEVVFGDSTDVLTGLIGQNDVAYLDPMYRMPRRGKSRGPLNWLDRTLAEEADDEAAALLRLAQASGARRVVVKRPIKAAPLAFGVTGSVRGRTTRYDIYPATD